ncbi:MAG: N-acetyltransferase [Acidobacteria bacterium]|nr:N-acetyltransferase [Acidobacteriota bacterium]
MNQLVTLNPAAPAPRTAFTEGPLLVRPATLRDVPSIISLINLFAAKGIMLPRTEFELAENIRDFVVIKHQDQAVACCALHIYSTTAAEIRSLAVDPGWQSHGLGRNLVGALETQARELGITSLFAFTYVESFFSKLGYRIVDRSLLPSKAWKDCLRCPKFQACDEIAMLKSLE